MTRPNGPTMIGIGAQKCASSWVHAALGVHPQIGVSNPKEVDFFSYYFDRGYQWYESHFAHSTQRPVRFEASPSYLYDPRSPGRVYDYDPAMKILLMLRDPIDRAYSNHLHEVIKGHIGPIDFAEGLANNPAYIEQGRYATHLKRWLSVFPREHILVLLAEDVSANPDAAAQQVYAFAGVDQTFTSQVLHERRNESDRARFPVLRQVLRSGGTALRKLGLEERLAALKKSGPVARMMSANSVDIRKEIAPLDAASRAHLQTVFAPEIDELRRLLGRDTLPWKTARQPAQG